MRLSLYILADWLGKYHPVRSITMGERTIRNVRMFSDGHRFLDNNVYISRTGVDTGQVICMHKNDYILLQTEDESQVMNDIMDAFDFYNDWSDGLNRELRALEAQEILERSAGAVGAALLLTDASYYMMASSGTRQGIFANDLAFQSTMKNGIMDIQHILNVERDPRIRSRGRVYVMDGGFPTDPAVRNLFTGGSHWGWLVGIAPSLTRGQMDVMEELGDILEQWMALSQENQSQWERKGVFLSILDGTNAGRDAVGYRLRLLGWKEETPKRVYAFTNAERSLAMIHKVEELSPNVQAVIWQERLLAFFQGTELQRRRFEEALTLLLSESGCRCGISPEFTDIFTLGEQAALAGAAAAYSDRLLCPFSDHALEYGLTLLARQTGAWFSHPALGLLREYDRKNHTDLYETLRQFLRWERSYARTSQETGLHRNTLLYRVQRILELTGLDLEDPRVRLHLGVSFALGGPDGK